MSCNGNCCAVFHLSRPADRIDEMRASTEDGEMIADMVIALSYDEASARREKFGLPAKTPEEHETEGGWYTCRHWDEATRLCTVYETRPKMCAEYPYDQECQHACGFVADAETRAKWVEIRAKQREEATS